MPKIKNIFPVDSEHSAIWQCLNFKRDAKIKNLIITASGGPFRNEEWSSLKSVTPAQALNHPTWKMGKKITIDSSTLLNKGYEVIEAHHLYGTPYQNIHTVIQPQSIIHSMVEFDDGAILAQMSNPTMELPIQLALTQPQRLSTGLKPLDFTKPFSINFEPLDRSKYPMYNLALCCGEKGGIYPTALNAASEEAVNAFLNGQIAYTDIFTVTDGVVNATAYQKVESYAQLAAVDKQARIQANKIIKEV
jgi:1-deoxy-D-xylulose-5-phosphate reductoisomerase